MNSPATFFALRVKGKNAPVGIDGWSVFWDDIEKVAKENLGGKFEAVRITVEILDDEAKKTTATAERDYWRRVAAYLASCHAASAMRTLERKSMPKNEKSRMIEIMKFCVSVLKGVWPGHKLQSDDIEPEIRRCQSVIDHYKDKA
jgi:hypothetical protein